MAVVKIESGDGEQKMENQRNKPIRCFQDLIVYQNLYRVMLIVLKEIIVDLPKEEQFDLSSQMRRACKAPPALIAEAFAKRYQKRNWIKYLNDTMGEANEMIHHLSVCIDVYSQYVNVEKCKEAINTYDVACKQLTKLGQSWTDYHKNK